jgi:hypothetical protein
MRKAGDHMFVKVLWCIQPCGTLDALCWQPARKELFIVCLNFEAQQLIGVWRRYQKPPHSRAPTSVDFLCSFREDWNTWIADGSTSRAAKPNGACHLVTSSARVKQSKPNHLSLSSQSPGILIANPIQVGFVMMVVLPRHVDVKKDARCIW